MDKNVSLDSHALNLQINYFVLSPIMGHVFGLMDHVMIIKDVKMQSKRPLLNVKHFHHYVQLMEINAFPLHLVATHN